MSRMTSSSSLSAKAACFVPSMTRLPAPPMNDQIIVPQQQYPNNFGYQNNWNQPNRFVFIPNVPPGYAQYQPVHPAQPSRLMFFPGNTSLNQNPCPNFSTAAPVDRNEYSDLKSQNIPPAARPSVVTMQDGSRSNFSQKDQTTSMRLENKKISNYNKQKVSDTPVNKTHNWTANSNSVSDDKQDIGSTDLAEQPLQNEHIIVKKRRQRNRKKSTSKPENEENLSNDACNNAIDKDSINTECVGSKIDGKCELQTFANVNNKSALSHLTADSNLKSETPGASVSLSKQQKNRLRKKMKLQKMKTSEETPDDEKFTPESLTDIHQEEHSTSNLIAESPKLDEPLESDLPSSSSIKPHSWADIVTKSPSRTPQINLHRPENCLSMTNQRDEKSAKAPMNRNGSYGRRVNLQTGPSRASANNKEHGNNKNSAQFSQRNKSKDEREMGRQNSAASQERMRTSTNRITDRSESRTSQNLRSKSLGAQRSNTERARSQSAGKISFQNGKTASNTTDENKEGTGPSKTHDDSQATKQKRKRNRKKKYDNESAALDAFRLKEAAEAENMITRQNLPTVEDLSEFPSLSVKNLESSQHQHLPFLSYSDMLNRFSTISLNPFVSRQTQSSSRTDKSLDKRARSASAKSADAKGRPSSGKPVKVQNKPKSERNHSASRKNQNPSTPVKQEPERRYNQPLELNFEEMLHVKPKHDSKNRVSNARQENPGYHVYSLDSSAPTQRRGKEREKPKIKKPSTLRKIILKERQSRHSDFFGETPYRSRSSQSLSEGDNLEKDEFRPYRSASADELPMYWIPPTRVLPAGAQAACMPDAECDPVSEADYLPTAENLREALLAKVHSRKFREYCSQVINKDINNSCVQLLRELLKFQKRQLEKDPSKIKLKRRVVMGLHEVTKHLKLHKLKCVIIAPNVERVQSSGGLDDVLCNIISLCQDQNIPFIFALNRLTLGRACGKKAPVSAVGIFNYDGANACFHELCELTERAREQYQEMVDIVVKELEEEEKIEQKFLSDLPHLQQTAESFNVNCDSTQ